MGDLGVVDLGMVDIRVVDMGVIVARGGYIRGY